MLLPTDVVLIVADILYCEMDNMATFTDAAITPDVNTHTNKTGEKVE